MCNGLGPSRLGDALCQCVSLRSSRERIFNRKVAHETIQVTGIFQDSEISVDMIGPLPLSKLGSQYILVALDSFARFLFLKACKSTGAEDPPRPRLARPGLWD